MKIGNKQGKNNTKNQTKPFSIFFAAVGLFISSVFITPRMVQAAPDSTLYFDPSSDSVSVNSDFSLDAVVDPGTNQVSAAELHVTFDHTKFSLTSITVPSSPADCSATPTFSTTLQSPSINNTNGTASVVLGVCISTPIAPVVTTTTVATFNFHAISDATDSPIDFTSVSAVTAIGELDDVITTQTGATITVTETAGANPPVLTQITPVSTPGNDPTPSYTFVSDQNGAITYTGSCSSTLPDTVVADVNKTVTFDSLDDGTYADCKIRVTNGDGDYNTLTATSFTIDTTAPRISSVSSSADDGSYTVDNVIDIDVTFSEAVTSTEDITVTLETGGTDRTCTISAVSEAESGTCNYTVQAGDTSSDLTTNLIATIGTITDEAGNPLVNFSPVTNLAANKALVIDTTAPVISEVTPVNDPTTDRTPDYVFTSDESGTIVYGGSCTEGNTSASSGSNTVTFGTMADGTYDDCTIAVRDAATNLSNVLNVPSFTVDADVPYLSGGAPSGSLSSGTITATLAVTTDEASNCKFGTVADTEYDSIANTFTTTGGTTHSEPLTGLSDGTTYHYYVRCAYLNGNANVEDYAITFSVAEHHSDSKKKEKENPRRIGNIPKTVARGKILIDYGKKFSKNSPVALYFSKSDGSYYPPRIVKTNSKGSFSLAYLVPKSKLIGKYNWYAVNLKTGWKSAKQNYKVK